MLDGQNIPFQTINWNIVPKEEFMGEEGISISQSIHYQGLRIRLVEFCSGYLADHWCKKGHFVYVLNGEFDTELKDGKIITLKEGMSFIVSDELSEHRSSSANGVKLLIIDGDFLRFK
jgi:hypothetical protein